MIIRDILLFIWATILFANPIMVSYMDYATLCQLEIAYVLFMILLTNKIYGNKISTSLTGVFFAYYIWIFATDPFLKDFPLWVSNLETMVFCIAAFYRSSDLTKRR